MTPADPIKNTNSYFKHEPFYLADCIFICRKKMKNLPELHGARWTAWLRYACKAAGLSWDDAFLGLYPFRSGRLPVMPSEQLRLRLILNDKGRHMLPALIKALTATNAGGNFNADTLNLKDVVDPLNGGCHIVTAPDNSADCQALNDDILSDELKKAEALDCFTLSVTTPLRITLPAGMKHMKMKNMERFCNVAFFESCDTAVSHLLNCVHGFPRLSELVAHHVIEHDLEWMELHYSYDRRISLGGVTGYLTFEGKLTDDEIRRLVYGQYLGTGKTLRFGLGFYRVAELDDVRSIPLL